MSVQHETAPLEISASDFGRELLVIWQDPSTRRFRPIGTLAVKGDGFSFTYHDRPAQRLASIPAGEPEHWARNLPAFFANRVIDPRQPSFDAYVAAFDLSKPVSPVELLVRSGGRRVTDTFQIVEFPRFDADGQSRQHFFVSAVRHVGQEAALAILAPGERLSIQPEPTNPVNREALRLLSDAGVVGYVPDWQLPLLKVVAATGGSYSVHVIRVNPPDQGAHLRVLASLDITVPRGSKIDSECLFEPDGQAIPI